jgi:putative transposase
MRRSWRSATATRSKTRCYVALGVNLDGERDVLGLWSQPTEGAKFWLHVLIEFKTRGMADILFVCVDGLTGARRNGITATR